MEDSNTIAENKIREAMENGVFDDLPGKGQPLDLSRGPFEDSLAPTVARILRDNGSTHPLIEARRALEEEAEACRTQLGRAWSAKKCGAPDKVWDQAVASFRKNAAELNRAIKLNNLRAPIPNLTIRTLDIEAEILRIRNR
jgi:DnaJ family protein C protein 28